MTRLYESVLFFDLDGTLMVNPFGGAVWPRVMADLQAQTGQAADDLYTLIEAEYDSRQADLLSDPIHAMDWDDITRTVAARLGAELRYDLVALVEQYAASHAAVLDDGLELLPHLQSPERALVVATKGLARYQQPVLDALGLTPHFSAILTPDVHHGLKRDRAFFGDWPGQGRTAIMIGDRYDDDVLYPSGHGLRSIWKPAQDQVPKSLHTLDPFERAQQYPWTADQPAHAEAIIFHLRELLTVIPAMEAATPR
jgi:putative hydrolase of the HAD superfamily